MKTFRYTIHIYIQSLCILAFENISICHKHSQSSSTWPKGKIYVIRRSTITHNYMSAQMHVTKHDYRKLSVSLVRVHPSSTCHRSRLQPQPSLFVFLLLPGFDAAPSRSTFSTSSKRPFCSRRRFNSSYAQEGVLTLPTATGQWRYFPIPSPIFLVRWE